METGKLIVIVAPSGTGKSTLIKKLKLEVGSLVESVSFTTRKMRPGEVEAESYHFISVEKFKMMREDNEFLEWAEVHSNFYGTSKKFVEDRLDEGAHLLFDLDVQGADAFKDYFKERAAIIFIAPPSVEELEVRLHGRGTESTGVINLRITNAKKEVLRQNDYDFKVVNDELDKASIDLLQVIESILKA